MLVKRLSSNRKLVVIVGCLTIVGLGALGLVGPRWTGVYPTGGLVATTSDVPPPQLDWVNGTLVGTASIPASGADPASSIGGNLPNLAAAGLGSPNHVEVSAAPNAAKRSLAMRFGGDGSLYWVVADAEPGLTMTQMREWPRLCSCGGVISLGATDGVLLHQVGVGRPHSVTWLDGTGYRWSVFVPPGSPMTDSQVEAVARSLVGQQVIKSP
jgi:hypothetical protein